MGPEFKIRDLGGLGRGLGSQEFGLAAIAFAWAPGPALAKKVGPKAEFLKSVSAEGRSWRIRLGEGCPLAGALGRFCLGFRGWAPNLKFGIWAALGEEWGPKNSAWRL